VITEAIFPENVPHNNTQHIFWYNSWNIQFHMHLSLAR
jgi:hypothetical protein